MNPFFKNLINDKYQEEIQRIESSNKIKIKILENGLLDYLEIKFENKDKKITATKKKGAVSIKTKKKSSKKTKSKVKIEKKEIIIKKKSSPIKEIKNKKTGWWQK